MCPFIPREQIQAAKQSVSPQQVARHFGVEWPDQQGGELRVNSIFAETNEPSSYGSLCINLDHADNRFFDHVTGTSGDILVLVHGLLTNGQKPSGGSLRGREFTAAAEKLIQISRGDVASVPARPQLVSPSAPPKPLPSSPALESSEPVNPPLASIEKARQFVTLYEELITDESKMQPKAAQYVRRYPFLTPEVMERWKIGYMPKNGRSMLRGTFVFTHVNENNEVLSYSGRRLNFESDFASWVEAGGPAGKQPEKYKYIKGFHKGSTLYGDHGRHRLVANPLLCESLDQIGLVVCEGQLDTIRLDCLNVAAVSLLTNRATNYQIRKITEYALQLAGGKVLLLPDNDHEGEEGFKSLFWTLAKDERLSPVLGWSRGGFGGQFEDIDPARISDEDWNQTLLPSFLRRLT